MIRLGNKELSGRRLGTKNAIRIMKGSRIVWEAITSCFGYGSWRKDSPWSENDAWKE